MSGRTPCLKSKHALVGFHYIDSEPPHRAVDRRQCSRLRMGRALMEKDSSLLDLILVELHHELHVSHSPCALTSFPGASWYQRLILTEGNTGWASYESETHRLINILLGLHPVLLPVEVPAWW